MEKMNFDEVRVEGTLAGIKVGEAKKLFPGEVKGKGGKVQLHSEPMGIASIEKGLAKATEVESMTVWVHDTKNIELLAMKCRTQFVILGIEITDEVDDGLRAFNLNTFDQIVAAQVDICRRISQRANRKVSESDHQLTWYDVAQACGLVHEAKQGDARAKRVKAAGDRIVEEVKLAEIERIKEQKAKEKAAKAEAKAEEKASLAPSEAGDE